MVDDFINRRHGRAEVSYPHPLLEPILKPTYGVIVYQEQVMQIAQVLAGYSLGGADLLRRAMGKKKPEEMAKERFKFEDGAEKNGIAARVASSIFDLMEKFADYGFNKSHSAAYALIAYQTAWLKAHYPAEFMAATLSSDMDNTDKVVNFLDDARLIGLKVLPPDVNASDYMFAALDAKTIRYGLGAVKGVGRGACEAIADSRRRDGPFRDLLDFCQRVDSSQAQPPRARGAGQCRRAGRPRREPRVAAAAAARSDEGDRAAGARTRSRAGLAVRRRRRAGDPKSSCRSRRDWSLEQKLARRTRNARPFPQRPSARPVAAANWPTWSAPRSATWSGCSAKDATTAARRRWCSPDWSPRCGDAATTRPSCRSRTSAAGWSAPFSAKPSPSSRRCCRATGSWCRGRLARGFSFNGGFSLRARQCWDFRALCAQYGRRLALTVDLREKGAWERLQQAMAALPARRHAVAAGPGEQPTLAACWT